MNQRGEIIKLCECGCGQPAPIAKRNIISKGETIWKKGQAKRFIFGHQLRNRRGPDCNAWNGGTSTTGEYILNWNPNHPRASRKGYVLKHILIAEKALGKPLPTGAEIHHLDGDAANNNQTNLVVCENRKYHALLHLRKRAIDEGHPANYRKCPFCKQYDKPCNMYMYPSGLGSLVHRECANKDRRERRSMKTK